MSKLNNRGVTLTELLVSLAILAVFMTSVTYFITSMSKGTSTAKKQVQVQQDAQDVYEDMSQMIMQAKCIVLKTDEILASSGEASSDPSADAFEYYKAHYTSADDNPPVVGDFEKGYLISKNCAKSLLYAVRHYGANSDPLQDYKDDEGTKYVLGATARYRIKKGADGKLIVANKLNTISNGQNEVAKMALDGKFASASEPFSVFQQKEYSVQGLYLGPITIKEGGSTYTRYNTIVYDGNKIYLNRNTSGPDFDTHRENIIAENCYNFSVIPSTGKTNSLYLKLTLLSGGAEGTVDASYSADANTVTRKTAAKGDNEYLISKAGYTYTIGGTVNIRNAGVLE